MIILYILVLIYFNITSIVNVFMLSIVKNAFAILVTSENGCCHSFSEVVVFDHFQHQAILERKNILRTRVVSTLLRFTNLLDPRPQPEGFYKIGCVRPSVRPAFSL